MSLWIDVGLDDLLRIGDTLVTVERKSGTRVRMRIRGDAQVELVRHGKSMEQAGTLPCGGTPLSKDEN